MVLLLADAVHHLPVVMLSACADHAGYPAPAMVVRVSRASAPDCPALYHRGELAEAESAAPGWRLAVDDLFE